MPTLKPAKPAILRVADRPTLLSREKSLCYLEIALVTGMVERHQNLV